MKLVVITCLFGLSFAYSTYRDLIPNGHNVPHPCRDDKKSIWYGVGHLGEFGGGERNKFGQDFAAFGSMWTTALCKKDSDEDGRSNGEELGDPDCKWTSGNNPGLTATGHPGVCEPYDTVDCQRKNSKIAECKTDIVG